MSEQATEIEFIEDSQILLELETFFNMAIEIEKNKFNLYPDEANEMQLKCINLVMKRLEMYE